MQERRAAYLERLRCRFAGWDLGRLDAAADLLEELAQLLVAGPPDSLAPHHDSNSTRDSTHDSEDHA